MKKILILLIIGTLTIAPLLVTISSAFPSDKQQKPISDFTDFDPLVDIQVTVDIQKIRSLEKFEYPNIKTFKKIDLFSEPDFFVKVFINNQEFTSPIWYNTKYVNNPQFTSTLNVLDDVENVSIIIQLFDWNSGVNRLCDINAEDSKFDVELIYSIKTGHWTKDDYIGDYSGYGRLNGCDDGSIYKPEKDCELWFSIYQNDFDGDGIPYWTEINDYGTDPTKDNTGEDTDNDNIPIEWEWKWRYDPFYKDSHTVLDFEHDGLNNYEEYLTSEWDSDPFRQDIYIELDQMEDSPDGTKSILPEGAKELLYTAFNRYNKVLHIDDGYMGGGEIIPFDDMIGRNELDNIYMQYFLHNNENNWRKGVFRYSLIVYGAGGAGYNFRRGAFVVSSRQMEIKTIPKTKATKDMVYASGYMHETGHTLDIHNSGVDNRGTYFPWQAGFWIWGRYKSCMNYRYVFRLVDYSDGSRFPNDFNDWEEMDLTAFQRPW